MAVVTKVVPRTTNNGKMIELKAENRFCPRNWEAMNAKSDVLTVYFPS